jgi:serine/threonine protein kinase/formylglycine-generating enzyme required for sulfatase activity
VSAITDDRNRLLQSLFERALDLPAEGRQAFLAEQDASETLRAEVLELLALADQDPSFLSRPLQAGESTWQKLLPSLTETHPESVGPCTLLRLIGAGGMGRVFLAEQQHPRRQVAVKLLFGRVQVEPRQADGAASDADAARADASRRFQREIAALARLQHPGLAQVLDAGIERSGQAWISMHFVEGRPLIETAEEQRLGVRERLLLLARVCDAVDYAHRQGVVHCDLKPGNVLLGRDGQPVVLDFGIARVASPGGPVTLDTSLPRVLGTLAYMSPEQAAGERRTLDVRTDVYALGVLLYELLTGRTPFVTRGLPLEEALVVLQKAEPVPLGPLPGNAGREDASVDPRELQLLVTTALARQLDARYTSAAALAEDLRRCAEGRPILAQPPSVAKRLRLLWSREPMLCAALLLATLVLSGGLVVAAAQWNVARAEEDASQTELAARVRLSDRRALHELKTQADRSWPVRSQDLPELGRLAAIAADLHSRRDLHRARLQDLQSDRRLSASATARAADWEKNLLAKLVPALDVLGDPDPAVGLLADLRRRLEYASGVEQATVLDQAKAWAAARDGVARDPRFGGLVLAPQSGLIPLGADPHTGLQEFGLWFWTGAVPRRDPADRELILDEQSGVVLVLLPGGRSMLGSQAQDPAAPHYVAKPRSNEAPLVEVALDPFFIMKDEMTQGQYRRCMGSDPSTPQGADGFTAAAPLSLPVNHVTWLEAELCARRLGLVLPTEAQWEYAARAGTDSPWWPGTAWELLEPVANVADRSSLAEPNWPRDADGHVFDDGYGNLAPASVGRSNAFGLRHVHGNVWEHCLDIYASTLRGEFRAGDGLHLVQQDPDETELHSLRGGGFRDALEAARSSFRNDVTLDRRSEIGLRAARALDPERRDG